MRARLPVRNDRPIRVLIADDEAIVRDGLRAIIELETDLDVVGEAADGAEAITAARELEPDVALVDIQMSGLDGVEATRRLLALPHPPRVLILTTFDRNEYVYESLRAGASGFLLKDVRRGQLTDAIRTVVDGETLLAPPRSHADSSSSSANALHPEPEPHPNSPNSPHASVEVLVLLGRGLSNTEIATTLVVAETTIKTHVAHILTKLELRDRAQAVVVAYETGLVQPGESHGAG